MPKNPEGKEGREWLAWAIALSYGKAVRDLPPKERAAAVKKCYEFCTPPKPRTGPLLTLIFQWVIPGRTTLPMPTPAQVDAFRKQAQELVEMRLKGETQCRTGLGASPNYQPGLVSFESQDPVSTAVSRFGYFLSMNWQHVRRCPRAGYPKERCRRVFVLKKLPAGHAEEPYCSRRCRQRMRKREEDQITEDRYGVRGRKPKEGD